MDQAHTPVRSDTSGAADREVEDALMARFGIARVPADQFHVHGYRYSSLANALAQARRSRPVEP